MSCVTNRLGQEARERWKPRSDAKTVTTVAAWDENLARENGGKVVYELLQVVWGN